MKSTNYISDIFNKFDGIFVLLLGALLGYGFYYTDVNMSYLLLIGSSMNNILLFVPLFIDLFISLVLVISIIVGAFKKSVGLRDVLNLLLFGASVSLFIFEMVFNSPTLVEIIIMASIIAFTVIIIAIRFFRVNQDDEYVPSPRLYVPYIIENYHLILIATIFGVLGAAFGLLNSNEYLINLANQYIPFMSYFTEANKLGLKLVIGLGLEICVLLVTFFSHKREVSLLDSFVVSLCFMTLTYTAFSFTNDVAGFKTLFVNGALFLSWVVLSYIRSVTNKITESDKQVLGICKYYSATSAKGSLTTFTLLAIALGGLVYYTNDVSLPVGFLGSPLATILFSISAPIYLTLIALFVLGLFRGKLVKKGEVSYFDTVLYILTVGSILSLMTFKNGMEFVNVTSPLFISTVTNLSILLLVIIFAIIRICIFNKENKDAPLLGDEITEEEMEAAKKEQLIKTYTTMTTIEPSDEDVEIEISDDPSEIDLEEELVVNAQTGETLVTRYNKSMIAKLSLAELQTRDYYNQIKNQIMSYDVHNRLSWNLDSFNYGRKKVAALQIRGKTLTMYLALDPDLYTKSKYYGKNYSSKKRFKDIPYGVKIKSQRGVSYAKELIDIVMKEKNIKKLDTMEKNYLPEVKSKTELIDAKEIKVSVEDSKML